MIENKKSHKKKDPNKIKKLETTWSINTSWYWHEGEPWAQWKVLASDPSRLRYHGSTKAWTSQMDVSKMWQQSYYLLLYQANGRQRSYQRWDQRTQAFHLLLFERRRLVGLVGKMQTLQPHSRLHCPLSQTQFGIRIQKYNQCLRHQRVKDEITKAKGVVFCRIISWVFSVFLCFCPLLSQVQSFDDENWGFVI